MTQYKASRTLVKSPPELWSEVSEAASLKRHLDQFGEIRITRLEPETAVAWEGESARGTVKLEPSGWGTSVTLTAGPCASDAAGAIQAEVRELQAVLELAKPTRIQKRSRARDLMRAFMNWLTGEHLLNESTDGPADAVRAPEEQPAVESDDPSGSAAAPALALNSALDSLGRAHHRPYSRA
jgi:hypothetical protein